MVSERPSTLGEVPLLRTKLYTPAPRAGLVSRPHLISSLNSGLWRDGSPARKLTLISAPAGFGKTTLVAEWAHGLAHTEPPIAVGWLSLDESDNDPTRFLTYVVAALQTLRDGLAQGLLRALHSPQPPPVEAILAGLINEVAALSGLIMLVLDDYHLIDAQPVHDAVTFLLRHLPPQLHIVITTREDPLVPLARLRARGEVTELRAADLRFTSAEAAEFLNRAAGLALSAADITALETRTEGWIAGLQLAALALQGLAGQGPALRRIDTAQGRQDITDYIRSFSGSHRFVLDYLVEEVLEQQSEEIQAFLLRTSVLDQLTGPLCDALRCDEIAASDRSQEPTSSQAILEQLERANLFVVPLDDERRWYRYHHLFADLLEQRLRQAHGDWEPALHMRASEWYEQQGVIDYAVEHAFRANDLARATGLIEQHVDTMWDLGEHSRLQRWLSRLPDEWLCTRPQLCIYRAWFLFSVGHEHAARQVLQAAEACLDTSPVPGTSSSQPQQEPLSAEDHAKVSARLSAIRALMGSWQKEMPGVIQYAGEAMAALPEDDPWRDMAVIALGDAHYFTGDMMAAYQVRLAALEACRPDDAFAMIIANLKVATSLRELGQLQETIDICRQQVDFARERGLSHTIFNGWALALWALTLADRNELDQALVLANQSVDLTRGGDLGFSGFSHLVLAQVLLHRGAFADAEAVLQELEGVAPQQRLPFNISEAMSAWKARVWLADNRLESAARWAEEQDLDADEVVVSWSTYVLAVLARVLLAQGELEKANRLLNRLLEAAEAEEHTARIIEILTLQALTAQAAGHPAPALVALERALNLAEPGGYVCVFLDGGLPMARLLQEARNQGGVADYATRLLLAFPTAEAAPASPAVMPAASSDLLEPLSDREIEVLQLIAEGLTNREIASRLYLTLNTVKAHTRNIYGKLDVHSRTQAVMRAQTLGLLPPG